MSKIYYLGFYGDSIAYQEKRNIVPAGVNKMDYIAHAMGEAGFDVTIISPAWVKYDSLTGAKFHMQRKVKLSEKLKLIMSLSMALPFRITKVLTIGISKIWLILFFIFKVRKSDKVMAYHSPFYFSTLYWLRKLIKFHLILEVEEVYSIVFSMNNKWHQKEMRLISSADSYIFPNDLMYAYLKITNKKKLIVYGTYRTNDKIEKDLYFDDGKIHLVYAGIIDTLKNGAFNAINSAYYLPNNYIIHILGFGQEQNISKLIKEINDINAKSECKVIYEGVKTGDEYHRFISGCHIGLSTQKNEGEYLKFSFPSKVLSYLSSGLNVVTAKMDCLTNSEIDSLLHYYDNDSGQAIANAVLSIKDFDDIKIKSKINELNKSLIENLKYI